LGRSWFKASLGKKFMRFHLKMEKKLGVVVYSCHSSYGGKLKIGELTEKQNLLGGEY
jgi:hypothetical protein